MDPLSYPRAMPALHDAWTDALRRVLDDADLVQTLTEGARRHVLEHHRPADQLERLAGTFQQIVSGGAHRFAAEMP